MNRFAVVALTFVLTSTTVLPAVAQTDNPDALYYAGEFASGSVGAWAGTFVGSYVTSLVMGEGLGSLVGQTLGMALGTTLGVHGYASINHVRGNLLTGFFGALAGQSLGGLASRAYLMSTGQMDELSAQQLGWTLSVAASLSSVVFAMLGYHIGYNR